MKLFLTAILFSLSLQFSNAQEWYINLDESQKNDFESLSKSFDQYWQGKEYEKGRGIKQFERWRHYWDERLYPDYKFPSGRELLTKYQKYLKSTINESNLNSYAPDWQEVGPVNVPENWLSYQSSGLGRLNVVRISPVDDNEIWVGAASGGAWQTTTGGNSWNKIEIPGLLSLGVSDIAFAKSNPEIMYMATGDKNGSWMTSGYSVGVLKSTNGGADWQLTGKQYDIPELDLVFRVIVNPKNENLVFAGTSSGIYRSSDGGVTWNNVLSSGNIRDIEFKPGQETTIYASNLSQIWKSEDNGVTWDLKTGISSSRRIELAVTTANQEYVYAVVASNTGSLRYILRSEDSGENWNIRADSPNLLGWDVEGRDTRGQGFYDLTICTTPYDANEIYVGGVHAWKSVDGGANWEILNHWTGSFGLPYVHADQHYLEMNPNTLELYSANDGGIYVSSNQGDTWSDISDGLAIGQFYGFANSRTNPNLIVGGLQDNGSHMYRDGDWFHVSGADGMLSMIDYQNDQIIYTTSQYGTLRRSINGGSSFSVIHQGGQGISDWVTPLAMDYNDPSLIYLGRRDLIYSTNRGDTWLNMNIGEAANFNAFISNIEIAPSNTDYIYFTKRNRLYKRNVGSSGFSLIYIGSQNITDIKVSPTNPNHLWVTQSGYSGSDRVIEIKNEQENDISFNLPAFPVNTIEHLENDPGTLFVGTDIGIFMKPANENNWIPFNENLPTVVISDLEMNYASGMLRVATFARGIWETQLVECNIDNPSIEAIDGELSFCQGDSLLLSAGGDYDSYEWSNGETTKEIWVKESGNYFLTIKNELGCVAVSNYVTVNVEPVPDLSVYSDYDGYLCEGDSIYLNASFGYPSYTWDNGYEGRRLLIYEGGDYTVTARTIGGCENEITYPVVEVGNPAEPVIEFEDGIFMTQGASAYQWYLNGEPINGATKRLHKAELNGNYAVEVFNEFGCSAFSDVMNVTVGVEDVIADGIKIMPNPNSGRFSLSIDEVKATNMSIYITDMLGKEMILLDEFNNITNLNKEYSIDNLPNGTYILHIVSGNQRYTEKIIKISN